MGGVLKADGQLKTELNQMLSVRERKSLTLNGRAMPATHIQPLIYLIWNSPNGSPSDGLEQQSTISSGFSCRIELLIYNV